MRAWIFVLAVLATFQTIVQVASTISTTASDSAMVVSAAAAAPTDPAIKSKHHRRRTHSTSWSSSPVLSFAAIVAAPQSDESEFSLTNLNDIIINSDNVRHPPPHRKSSSAELLLRSSSQEDTTVAAAAIVKHNNNNNRHSVNSNLISADIQMHRESSADVLRRKSSRKHLGKGRRRRLRRPPVHRGPSDSSIENSVDKSVVVEHSNELSGVEEVDAEGEEEEEELLEEQEEVVRRKPDPETLVAIEKNLLSLFGFKKRPSIDRSKVVIPEAMRRLYAETTGEELDLTNLPKPALSASQAANTVRSFTHEESKIDHRFLHHHRFRLHFNTSTIPKEEHLRAAELVLSRDAVPDADRIRHRVQVYDIVRPGIKGKREPIFLLIDTKVVKVNTTDNLILDVMPAMERWQREPKHNHGILVHVSTVRGRRKGSHHNSSNNNNKKKNSQEDQHRAMDGPMHHHVRLRRSATEPEESWTHKQPLLFAYTDDKRHRTTRAVREGHHGANGARLRKGTKRKPRGICQRHALWVDFEDVGWNDWIVAPRGYDAFYCKGECRIPMADHMNATNHAVVQTLVNSINSKLAPRACCVPTSLTSISLLYLDDKNKVVLKKYQEMAVTGCGCR